MMLGLGSILLSRPPPRNSGKLAICMYVYMEPDYSYLEVHCTYNLFSNCSYNLHISPITTVTLDIIGS